MSIHKRDKRFVVRWREGSRNRSKTFDRKTDAEKWELDTRRRSQLGLVVRPSKLTLEDWIAEWLVSKRDVEPETLKDYTGLLESHVVPFLGYLPLASLDPRMLDRWQRERLDAGAGVVAIGRTGTLLKSILERAAKYDLIARNPAAFLERPRHTKRIPTPATPEQIEGMRYYFLHGPAWQRAEGLGRNDGRTTRPSREYPPQGSPPAAWKPRQGDALLVSLMGYVGLRPGEALALEWSDLRADRIQVNKSNRDGRIKSTKTGNSRFAPVPAPVRKELVEWKIATASPGALLFPRRKDGLPWRKSNFTSWRERHFKAARDAAGLPESFTPYSLRHSAASLLIAAGRPITEVAAKLGHSPSTCLATYAHVIEEAEGREPIPVEQWIEEARAA